MVMCPYCKSTAQVKLGEPSLSRNEAMITLPCTCGCGCRFDLSYEVDNPSESFIHHVEKKG